MNGCPCRACRNRSEADAEFARVPLAAARAARECAMRDRDMLDAAEFVAPQPASPATYGLAPRHVPADELVAIIDTALARCHPYFGPDPATTAACAVLAYLEGLDRADAQA